MKATATIRKKNKTSVHRKSKNKSKSRKHGGARAALNTVFSKATKLSTLSTIARQAALGAGNFFSLGTVGGVENGLDNMFALDALKYQVKYASFYRKL